MTRYDVFKIGCKQYDSTLTPFSIQSAFELCGVIVFDRPFEFELIQTSRHYFSFPVQDLSPKQ